jgi:RecA-family ATPase
MIDLGERVRNWQRAIAIAPEWARLEKFEHACFDLMQLEGVVPEAADALAEMALAHDISQDAAQQLIANARTAKPLNGNGGADHHAPQQTQLPPLDYLPVSTWDAKPLQDRQWAVPQLVPARNVTLLSGDGGTGKTLLMLQLAVASVLGRDWLGTLPQIGPVLIISAEDDEEELHFRLTRIAKYYGATFADLSDLHIVSLVGKNSAIGIVDRSGLIKSTVLFESIARDVARIKPVWVGFDTAADMFIVDERDRVQARQCINMLRGLAFYNNTAALLLSHPSLSGLQSGSGMSGSTGWNNSVRSRLYLYTPKEDDDEEPKDENARVLETMKANYGPRGHQLRLRWHDGMLTLEPGQVIAPSAYDRAATENNAQKIFRILLEFQNKNDIPVSATNGARNFAPTVFAKMAQAVPLHVRPKLRMAALRNAMHAMLKAGEIVVGQGPRGAAPSKRNPCLYLRHTDDPEQGNLLI